MERLEKYKAAIVRLCRAHNVKALYTFGSVLNDKFGGDSDDQIDARSQKVEALKMAVDDPLFLADIQEIHADFDFIGEGK